MQSKHTPGPWSRNIKANGKYPIVFAGRNQHVAQAVQQKDGAETEANIDLIAAAPDLLAALEACLAALNAAQEHADGDVFGIHHNSAMDAMDYAGTAIAKARGQ